MRRKRVVSLQPEDEEGAGKIHHNLLTKPGDYFWFSALAFVGGTLYKAGHVVGLAPDGVKRLSGRFLLAYEEDIL